MTPTIRIFMQALQTPDLSFATLCGLRADTDDQGLPKLMRTTRFAEAAISWQGRSWLLLLPLSGTALATVERTVSRLGRLTASSLAPYRLLPDELRWSDPSGKPHTSTLLLQPLPEGYGFDEALGLAPCDRLLAALDDLRRELYDLGFAHRNLRPGNLRWTGQRFILLRSHDGGFGHPEEDSSGFASLRDRILTAAGGTLLSDTTANYDPYPRFEGHCWVSHIFEGLVCVEDPTGYGFVDTENREVIASRFLWANDFHEGRAEVETETGMGLIDREGHYVVEPRYEIVEYDPATSIVHVRRDGRWTQLDYLGRAIPGGTDPDTHRRRIPSDEQGGPPPGDTPSR